MDFNMYSTYYSGIKGFDPLISKIKTTYVAGLNQSKLKPLAKQPMQTQYPTQVHISKLGQPILNSRRILVQ
jgi:hypothetical protein